MSVVAMQSINKKIAATKEEIKNFTDESQEQSILSQFMVSELRRRLDSLLEERKKIMDSQSKETISLRIHGEEVEQGKISNRILISILNGFQSTVESIAQSVVGADGERGKFSVSAKELTDFQVAGTFAGSFGIVLEKDYGQIELESGISETTQILDGFFDVLENSGDSQRLIEYISPLGKRTVKHYKSWLKTMREYSVNVEINWVDENAESRKLDINHHKVKDTIFTLDNIKNIEHETCELHDVLVNGINLRRNTFEIETVDGSIIKGKGNADAIYSISQNMGGKVNLKLIKNTSYTQANVEKVTWYLAEKLIQEEK